MTNAREGDLYCVIELGGHTVEVRYGYYDPELERGNIEPTPIYPNFKENPLYTEDGVPFVTADQDICEYFEPRSKISEEGWCNDCTYLEKYEEFIGLCQNPYRQRQNE